MSYSAWETVFLFSLVTVIFLSGMILGAYLIAVRNAKVFKSLSKHLTKGQKDDIVIETTIEDTNENK